MDKIDLLSLTLSLSYNLHLSLPLRLLGQGHQVQCIEIVVSVPLHFC